MNDRIKCRKCGGLFVISNFYVCSGSIKKVCKQCQIERTRENTRKKAESIKIFIEKVKNGEDLGEVVMYKRKYKKRDVSIRKRETKIIGWSGDDEIFC